jgi:hypothetical protein
VIYAHTKPYNITLESVTYAKYPGLDMSADLKFNTFIPTCRITSTDSKKKTRECERASIQLLDLVKG